jgi:hypothetical protein
LFGFGLIYIAAKCYVEIAMNLIVDFVLCLNFGPDGINSEVVICGDYFILLPDMPCTCFFSFSFGTSFKHFIFIKLAGDARGNYFLI